MSLASEFDPTGGQRQVGMRTRDGRFVLSAGDGREVRLLYPGEIRPRGPQAVDVLKDLSAAEIERRTNLLRRLAAAADPVTKE